VKLEIREDETMGTDDGGKHEDEDEKCRHSDGQPTRRLRSGFRRCDRMRAPVSETARSRRSARRFPHGLPMARLSRTWARNS
jgi:hypothetical protein